MLPKMIWVLSALLICLPGCKTKDQQSPPMTISDHLKNRLDIVVDESLNCDQIAGKLATYQAKHHKSLNRLKEKADPAMQTDAEAQKSSKDFDAMILLLKSRAQIIQAVNKKCPQVKLDQYMEVLARAALMEEAGGTEETHYIFPPKDVSLPDSTSDLLDSSPAPQLIVSPRELRLKDQTLATLEKGNIPARYKKDGNSLSLQIEPLRKALEQLAKRTDEQPKNADKKEDNSRFARLVIPDSDGPRPIAPFLHLLIDRSTSFRVLSEILYSAGQAGFGNIRLAVRTGPGRTRLIRINPGNVGVPASDLLSGGEPEALNLTLFIKKDGLKLTAKGKLVEEFPLDYKRLAGLAKKIKAEDPYQTMVFMIADNDITCQTLVRAMDALRQDGHQALFYDVVLSVPIE